MTLFRTRRPTLAGHMGATIVDAFLRGHRGAWIGLLSFVVISVAAVLVQRAPKATPGRLLLTSVLVSLLSAFGILVGTALSVPRIIWRPAPLPPFAAATGASWRTARAPSTAVMVEGRPEVGVAGVGRDGRVRLFGLFSGAPLPGYPDADTTPPSPGRPRICSPFAEQCRAWPNAWPEPAAATSGSDFIWTRDLLSRALAYDVESALVLHHVEGLRTSESAVAGREGAPSAARGSGDGGWALEQLGKLTTEPSREGPMVLFVVRRLAADRLETVRLVSVPAQAEDQFTFSWETATVSLSAAPSAFAWFARPLLLALVLWFPFVSIALQGAPAWWASRRRKRMAAGEPLSEMPADVASGQRAARVEMARALHGPAIFAVGLALAAPAVVAVVGIVTSR